MSHQAIPSSVERMSPQEWRVGGALASIFGLRMLGLFLVLPVLSVYASGLPGGEDFQRVAWAFGAFMLVQALLYLPLGMASDRFGRHPVILAGLLVFAIGSLLAAWAPTVDWLIVARAVQGAGAVSAAVMALAADSTREQFRTRVMAMIGASIGLVFAFSLVAAPLLYGWIGMRGMFLLIAVLALAAIVLLYRAVPRQAPPRSVRRLSLASVLRHGGLMRANFGIFALHVMQTALFLVLPRELLALHGMALETHWQIYLPVVLASFVLAVPAILLAERHGRFLPVFLGGIVILLLSQAGLLWGMDSFWMMLGALLFFFVAFNVLEAQLPALVARQAPQALRGAAMGVFNTMQALGVVSGSVFGGWIAVHSGVRGVHGMCVALALAWALLAIVMRRPRAADDSGIEQNKESQTGSADAQVPEAVPGNELRRA